MSGFGNAVVGGLGKLVREFIRSANYVAGVSGWTINRDGSAEFNNGTFRVGVIVGTAGNPQVIITTSGSDGVIQFPSGAAYELTAAELVAAAGGSPAFISLDVFGPVVNVAGHKSQVIVELNSGNASGTSEANGVFQYQANNGTDYGMAVWDVDGFRILAGVFTAAALGTSPATPEAWNNLTLKNGFADGEFGPSYRSLDGFITLAFHGQLITPSTGTVTGIDACSTGGAPYAPTFGNGVFVRWPITSQTSPGSTGYAELHPDGNIQIFGTFGNNELVDITGVTFIA